MLRDPSVPSEVREGGNGPRRPLAPHRVVGGRGAATSRSAPASARSSPRLGENRLGIQQDFPVYPAPVAPAGATAGAGAPGSGRRGIVAAVVSRGTEGCKASYSVAEIWAVLVLLSQRTELL